MTQDLYTFGSRGIAARGCRYSSCLELDWHKEFVRMEWWVEYIGEFCAYADFRFYAGDNDIILGETKPHNGLSWERCEFVKAAAQRLHDNRITCALIFRGFQPFDLLAFRHCPQTRQSALWLAPWRVRGSKDIGRIVKWARSCPATFADGIGRLPGPKGPQP